MYFCIRAHYLDSEQFTKSNHQTATSPFADQKNPYFEPVSFWFATENKQQLNNQVSDFTSKLNQITDKYFDQLYFRQSKQIYDSVVYFIEKDFDGIKSESFQFHKKMSLKMVEVEAFRLKTRGLFGVIFGDKTAILAAPVVYQSF